MSVLLKKKPLATQVSIALGLMFTGMPALTDAAEAAKKADSGEIQSVTVTANRRAEDQQKVNVSVSAISGEDLSDRNISDLSQMESLVPGFTFGRSGSDARPAMRGVRTENVATNADTTIGYFVDGIYKSRAQQAMLGFTDVSMVEVLRGPQGTLYGRNTFGGTVSITNNVPIHKLSESSASLTIGNYNKRRLEGYVNVPFNDTVSLRVAGLVDKSDPYVRNDFNPSGGLFDQDLRYLRASLRITPSRDLDIVFRADITDQSGNGGSAFGYKQAGTYIHTPSCQQLFNATLTVINARPGNRDAVNDCTRTVGAAAGTGTNAAGSGVDLGIPIYKPGNLYRIDQDYRTFLNLSDRNLSLDVTYRAAGHVFRSITGYTKFSAERSSDSDFSASTIALDYQLTGARTTSQEFQVLSDQSGPLSYVGGVYFFRDKLTSVFINEQLPRTIRSRAAQSITLAQNGAGFAGFDRPTTDSDAVYGQFSYKLSSALTLTAGARATKDSKIWSSANANSVLPRTSAGTPDGNQIAINMARPGDAAFGATGVTNCVGSNAIPGAACDPGTNLLYGYTYAPSNFSKTTGKFGLDYAINTDQLIYGTIGTGFRSGGFNGFQVVESLRTFKPEEVTAIELGSKNRFLKNTLQVNAALFSNEYTNLQEQRQVPIGATTISTIFNAAKARANGIEAEIAWRQSPSLTVGSTLSLLDAKYTSFPDVALPFGTSILVADPTSTSPQLDKDGVVIAPAGQRRVFAPGYNCGVIPGTGGAGQPGAAYGCDLSGKKIPYAARYQGSVYTRHDIQLPNGTLLTPIFVATFSSGYYGQPTNAEIERQGAYVKGDIKLVWRVSDKLSLQGYIDNVTDKQTINRFVWGGGGALQISGAPPRMMGIRVTGTI
jgi:iron complex outermembrane receptor protein